MIHQLIFAGPKPGMTEEQFQNYWVREHAVNYAAKIPQIRRYLIDTRVAEHGETKEPLYGGIAEIWFQNEEEQFESLQSKEFLEGARLDEPRWAAFWKTLVLDTDGHVFVEPEPARREPSWVKLVTLLKRTPGMGLEAFRRYSIETHSHLACALPGLRGYVQCHVRDSFYVVGESRFDAVAMLWFEDMKALSGMKASPEYGEVNANLARFADQKYIFSMAARENWIIGP